MIFNGVIKALYMGDWESEFDLSRNGLPTSFLAVLLYIPIGFVVAQAAVKYNDVAGHVPYKSIALILVMIALTFPLIAYLLCMVFDKQDRFRAWVIVRNWALLFALLIIAFVFGLYLIGLLPFGVAFILGQSAYIGTLAVDVRLATRVADFDWVGAIFTGVLISITSMMVLMLGLQQAVV